MSTTYAGYSAAELHALIEATKPERSYEDVLRLYDAATAIPALLDHIARLEADNARLRGAAQTFCEERSDVALDRLIAAIKEATGE